MNHRKRCFRTPAAWPRVFSAISSAAVSSAAISSAIGLAAYVSFSAAAYAATGTGSVTDRFTGLDAQTAAYTGVEPRRSEFARLAELAALADSASTAENVVLPDAPSTARGRSFVDAGLPADLRHFGFKPTPTPAAQLPAQKEQAGAIDLTLDQAVAQGIKGNLAVKLSGQQELGVHGEIFTVGNALLPNLSAEVYSNAQEIDLAALGFKASLLSSIKIPNVNLTNVASIVKVDVTAAQLNLSQALFNVPAFFLFRAAEKALEASHWTTLDAEDQVVQGVGGLYLRALADTAQVSDAEALLHQDEVVYEHARAARDAGTGINLDVLRAQTDLLNERQRLLEAENAVAKDKIQLNRVMGQPAGQPLHLVDTVPFAELAEQPLEDQLALAYKQRRDLQGLNAQLTVAEETQRAIKYERAPTLGVGGYYGVVGVTTGSYHGNFVAAFQLSVPVLLEGELRGQQEVGAAQVKALRTQVAARRAQIEADIRASRLDLESSDQLVKVARSNVVLAQQALDDASLRFTSGVDDNLPVAQAQAALVGAQAQVIQAEFQYNYAKLTLARNLGVVQTDYDKYLGR